MTMLRTFQIPTMIENQNEHRRLYGKTIRQYPCTVQMRLLATSTSRSGCPCGPRPKPSRLYHLAHSAHTRQHSPIVDTGGSEIFHRPEWAHWQDLQPFGVGTGITRDEADKIATKVHLAETLTYTEAVHQEVLTLAA